MEPDVHKEVFMSMVGDGPEGQPTEGVVTLDSLAAGLDAGDEQDMPEESAEGEEAEDSEEVEGEGEEEEGEDEPSAPVKQKFTIKHDGKEIELELTPEEHVEMLQKSFDYTKKTMAVAEKDKAVEVAKQQAESIRQRNEQALSETLDRLNAYSAYMESQVGQPPPITLAQQDAASYLAQKELYEARKGQLQQTYAEIQRLNDDKARQRQALIAEKAESTEKVLRDTLPGWNDDTLSELAKAAEGYGLNPQTADMAMLEPGFWQLLHKAKAYDALQEQKAKLKPVKELPKVTKTGSSQPPQLAKRQEAMKRHKSAPSLNTLADLL